MDLLKEVCWRVGGCAVAIRGSSGVLIQFRRLVRGVQTSTLTVHLGKPRMFTVT